MSTPWPQDLEPSETSFWLEAHSLSQVSPLNRVENILSLPGARWRCEMRFTDCEPDQAAELDALIAGLDGSAGVSLVPPFRRADRFADLAGAAAVVDGAGQSGLTLATRGWTPESEALRKGDYLQVGRYFGIVLARVVADAEGRASFTLRPALPAHLSPADNAEVVVSWPCCEMYLADDAQGANPTAPGLVSSYSLSLLQVLYP